MSLQLNTHPTESSFSLLSVPPTNISSCIGVVCNGEIEISEHLEARIKECYKLIGVDGGLNFCKKMNLQPNWTVGDFDSVEINVIEHFQNVDSTALLRAKDCTDLEAAILQAKKVSEIARIMIWGGIGGRLDHALHNIFLLLRDPGQIFLESEKQTLFGLSSDLGEVEILHDKSSTIALIPLNGPAKDISILTEKERLVLPHITKENIFISKFDRRCKVNIGSGELLVILDQREIKPLKITEHGAIKAKFSIDQPVIHTFGYLFHQSLHSKDVKLISDPEGFEVVNIQKSSNLACFPSKIGETVSLIPFYGPSKKIQSDGLKWELGENTLDELDKNFVGTSNVSMKEEFSVSVQIGEILCISNKNLIDHEMVSAKIPKKV